MHNLNIFATIVQKLKKQQLYQKGIAFFLLIMYLFISAPVNFWHHHEFTPTAANDDASGKTDVLQATSDASIKANCHICSHHYSAYYQIALQTQLEMQRTVSLLPFADYIQRERQGWSNIFTNKGPPSRII